MDILLHRHIFKNAGSTLDSVLQREFGPRFHEVHEEGNPDGRVTADHLSRFLATHPDARAVSSHHFHGEDYREIQRRPAGDAPRTVLHDALLVRHPIARVVSIYNYYNTIDDPSSGMASAARQRDFKRFVEYLIWAEPYQINNAQVTLLGRNGDYHRPPMTAELDIATRLATRASICGTVERYDDTMTAAEYFLGPSFPGLRLHYEPQNVSLRPFAVNPRDDAAMRDALGHELHNHLLKLNELDMELWRRASAELDRRVELIWRFDERLTHFKSRVRRLSPEFLAEQLSSQDSPLLLSA